MQSEHVEEEGDEDEQDELPPLAPVAEEPQLQLAAEDHVGSGGESMLQALVSELECLEAGVRRRR